jgi:hypothetical protein
MLETLEARKDVRSRIQNAAVILLIASLRAPMRAPGAAKPVPVHGQGCVSQGVDPRCLVVRDQRNGKLYNLIFKEMQPAIGEGIEFEAVPHQGPVVCVQGAAFDVMAWERKDTLRCKPKAAPKQ